MSMCCVPQRIGLAAACLITALCPEAVRAQQAGLHSYGTPSYLEFSDSIYTVPNDHTNAVITVVRTGEFRQAASVQYSTADGTARAGLDYFSVSGTLLVPAGVGLATFSVPLVESQRATGPQTVLLTLSNPSPNAMVTRGSATLTIGDGVHSLPPGTPLLAVRQQGGINVLISWSSTVSNSVLEKSADPAATNWVRVMTAPQTAGGCLVVSEPVAAAKFFYRLRLETVGVPSSP